MDHGILGKTAHMRGLLSLHNAERHCYPWLSLLLRPGDPVLVAFSPLCRPTLQRTVEPPQHAPDMTGVIAHASQALDHYSDQRQGPEISLEAVRPGPRQ